jgi:3-oxoacyl-[acyl-carrier-protein] synthase II
LNAKQNVMDNIVISGMGMITPFGVGVSATWEAMKAGRSGIRRITKFDVSRLRTQIAGMLPDEYDDFAQKALNPRLFSQATALTRLAILTAKQALEDAEINIAEVDPYRVGVAVGTAGGSIQYIEELVGLSMEHFGITQVEVLTNIKYQVSAPAGMISLESGLKGPSFVFSSVCASGADAVARGCDLLRVGHVDYVVAGGVDLLVSPGSLLGFSRMRVLSERNKHPEAASRPFEKDRDGFVLSDGACFLVLEREESARARGRYPYARVLGYASTNEAYHVFRPKLGGSEMAIAMTKAIEASDLEPTDIQYISAHGTATIENDACETAAIRKVYDTHAYDILVSSQKSMIGHMMGAGGAVEVAVTALTLKEGIVTPTINLDVPDPMCDLNYVPHHAMKRKIWHAASNSFGFTGHCACVVLGAL